MKAQLCGLIVGLILGVIVSSVSYPVQAINIQPGAGINVATTTPYFTTETDHNKSTPISSWSRSQAYSYANTGMGEPYTTLGGWWVDNNVDDGFDSIKGYEGMDCSGLTFKSWSMKYVRGTTGYAYWPYAHDVHGGYQATNFYSGCSGACSTICGSGTSTACGASSYGSTEYMDAFAHPIVGSEPAHVAMIKQEDVNGWDYVFTPADPGGYIEKVDYRNQPHFDGIRRNSW